MDLLGAVASVAGVAALGVGTWQLRVAVLDRRDARRHGPGPRSAPPVGPADSGALPVAAPYGRLPEEVLGRDALKAQLRRVMSRRGRRARETLVIAGMGGVGKSTVALWLAAEFRRRGRPVWWVNAADPVSLRGGILEILRRLDAPEPLLREVRDALPTAADRFWAFLAGRPAGSRRALLVFDNADQPAVLAADGTSSPADGAGWVRAGGDVLTVVTTRVGDSRVWGSAARVVPLKVLDEVAAAAVLRGLAPQVPDPDGQEAPALARRLGTLPLALHLAGAYLTSPLARWRSFQEYRLALDGGTAAEAVAELDGARSDSRTTVSRTWELSLDALAGQGTDRAREVLYRLACLAPATPIPGTLLGPEDDGAVLPALRGLAELALVDTIPAPGRVPGALPDLVLHPVVADTCRARMTDGGGGAIPAAAAERISAAVGALDPERPSDWPEWERLIPHLQALLTWAAPHLDPAVLSALLRAGESAGYSLWLIGRRENGGGRPGEELGHVLLTAASRLGDRHPDLLSARHGHGVTLVGKGRPREAEELFRAVLADRRSVLGDDHLDTLLTRDQLVGAILAQGRYDEAEQMYRDLIADQEVALGAEHPQTLTTYVDLAWSIGMQGRAEEAAELCRRALEIDRRVVGEENPKTLDAWADLARWTGEGGSHQDAHDLCTRLLEVEDRVLGAEHPLTLVTRATLARTVAALGRPGEAERILREVVAKMEPVLSDGDPRMLTTRRDLAGVLAAQGRTRPAQRIYHQVLRLQRQHLGEAHPDTVDTTRLMARHT
ncbi:tetratricopeptide repeat protein [Actinomadura scrupuli]|uniref:tetratricopeptide repeat protein n=1 Tax=Actinomadura scrupuli TaxID=559629 RepID=UPI003D96B6F8